MSLVFACVEFRQIAGNSTLLAVSFSRGILSKKELINRPRNNDRLVLQFENELYSVFGKDIKDKPF